MPLRGLSLIKAQAAAVEPNKNVLVKSEGPKARKLTDDELSQLREAWKRTGSVTEAAKALNVSLSKAKYYVQKWRAEERSQAGDADAPDEADVEASPEPSPRTDAASEENPKRTNSAVIIDPTMAQAPQSIAKGIQSAAVNIEDIRRTITGESAPETSSEQVADDSENPTTESSKPTQSVEKAAAWYDLQRTIKLVPELGQCEIDYASSTTEQIREYNALLLKRIDSVTVEHVVKQGIQTAVFGVERAIVNFVPSEPVKDRFDGMSIRFARSVHRNPAKYDLLVRRLIAKHMPEKAIEIPPEAELALMILMAGISVDQEPTQATCKRPIYEEAD